MYCGFEFIGGDVVVWCVELGASNGDEPTREPVGHDVGNRALRCHGSATLDALGICCGPPTPCRA